MRLSATEDSSEEAVAPAISDDNRRWLKPVQKRKKPSSVGDDDSDEASSDSDVVSFVRKHAE